MDSVKEDGPEEDDSDDEDAEYDDEQLEAFEAVSSGENPDLADGNVPDPVILDAGEGSPTPVPQDSRSGTPNSEGSHKELHSPHQNDMMKVKVASDLTKQHARQHRRYHSKKGSGGRQKGSKAKTSGKIKLDGGGFWD